MAIGIDLRISQDRGYPVLESLGDEMLRALRFFMDLIPGILQYVVQKKLQQPMVAHKFPSSALAGRGQPDSPVLLIHDQRRALYRQALQHPRD